MLRMSPKTSNTARGSAYRRGRGNKWVQAPPAREHGQLSLRCACLPLRRLRSRPLRCAKQAGLTQGDNPPGWLTLRCWAARTAGPGCPFTLHAGQPSAPLHPRRVSAESASNESSRPGIIGIVPRLRWHEGPTGTTLLAALRGWAPVLLPVRQTTHIVRSVVRASLPPLF